MEHHKKITPGFFFITIGTIIALIVSVTALINTLFEILNKTFPDTLLDNRYYGSITYDYQSLRNTLSLLIIIFPIYLVLEYFWKKITAKENTLHNHTLGKWAIFLILFLTSAAVVIDLVVLIRYFVSGELTIRFILKVLVVLIVSLFTGFFYIRKLLVQNDRKQKIFAILSSIFVLITIVHSFILMGSPMKQRDARLDERRIQDLQTIQWQIINYWQRTEKLPPTLEATVDSISGNSIPQDPEGKPYEYKIKDNTTFSLCAVFTLPSLEQSIRPTDVTRSSIMPIQNEQWSHDAGYTCFDRVIDPLLYPKMPISR